MRTIEMTEKIYEMLRSNDTELQNYAKQVLRSADVIYVNKDDERRIIPLNVGDVSREDLFSFFILIDYRIAKRTNNWRAEILTTDEDGKDRIHRKDVPDAQKQG